MQAPVVQIRTHNPNLDAYIILFTLAIKPLVPITRHHRRSLEGTTPPK